MTIGLCITVFNGYGKFLGRLFESLQDNNERFDQITIVVVGDDHGVDTDDLLLVPNVTIIQADEAPMGTLKNIAVENTPTDWIMMFDADDTFMAPYGVETIKNFIAESPETDVVAAAWIENRVGAKPFLRQCALPEDIARRGRGFFCNHSPFKKKFWEGRKFDDDSQFPHQYFLADLVEQGAKFKQLTTPTWVYNVRPKSRSATLSDDEQRDAYKQESETFSRIKSHYER